ncbi:MULTISPECIES: acyl-CoA thioesterase [Spirosoma]|uniref:Acyl-CoA thioesterase n=1 Tax=Spirosoma sordidisoli TaxID=2502893 RepID=A0A4Q2UH13_9BACT|nr:MULTISPECIES: acyl-CoA thioesterase [Spirosoma]RYC68454.1 acyl-CoA thioesterase [Spirosoma sordidisoli]
MKHALQLLHPLTVRFHEVDSYQIVWHGHYVGYFEEGREAFGRHYGLDYHRLEAEGYLGPIIEVSLDYRKSLRYGDQILVETTFVETSAPKLIFTYRLLRADTRELVCKGRTVQVLLDKEYRALQYAPPPFLMAWKQRWTPASS